MKPFQDQALAIGIGIMDNQIIDQVNIYEATKLAMKEAISQLSPQPEHLLIDAMKLGCRFLKPPSSKEMQTLSRSQLHL